MAILMSAPFRSYTGSGSGYAYTYPGALDDPEFWWFLPDGGSQSTIPAFSSVSGGADAYTVTWSTGHHFTHRYLASGGYGGGGCAHMIMRAGNDQYDMGWFISGGNMKNWTQGDTVFLRFRMRFDGLYRWDGEPSMQMKAFDWGQESGGGNRVIVMNECPADFGAICKLDDRIYTDGTHGGWSAKQGIGGEEPSPLCTPGLPVTHSTWNHYQVEIKTSASGAGYMKFWIDNNTYGSPSSQWLNRTLGVAGWTDSWNLGGGFMSETPDRDQGFMINDLEIGDSFDASWFPGGGGGGSTNDARIIIARA